MKKIALSVLAGLLALPAIVFAQNGAPPSYAFDIPKTDLDLIRKTPAGDRQIRVVDMGKYNMGIGLIYRGKTNDKPGDPIPVLYHDYTAETYIITDGSGILTTGGVIENKR